MAIIDKDTRMTVATRLANLNYKEQMDSSLAKLNELFEKYIIGKTPDDVLNVSRHIRSSSFVVMNHRCHLTTSRRRSFLKIGEVEVFTFTSSSLRNFLLLTKRLKISQRNFLRITLLFSKSRNISFLSETVTSWRSV